MIYADIHSDSFPELSKALNKGGVSENVIAIAREYLDESQPRDNSLLDKIPVQVVTTGLGVYEWKSMVSRAVKHEIKSDELKDRYVLLMHAIFGIECFPLITYVLANAFGSKLQRKELAKIFRSRFGDKAEACALAIAMSTPYNFNDSSTLSPKLCIQALEFAENNTKVVLSLCAYALDGVTLPEKQNIITKIFSGESNEYVKKAIETIKENLSGNKVSTRSIEIIAVAEGAYFDSELKEIFTESIVANAVNAVASVRNMYLDSDRILDLIAEIPSAVTADYINYIISMLDTVFFAKKSRYLETLAERYPIQYRNAVKMQSDVSNAKKANDILKKFNISLALDTEELENSYKEKLCKNITSSEEIRSYIYGEKNIDEVTDFSKNVTITWGVLPPDYDSYYKAYGADDFYERCITAIVMADRSVYFINNFVKVFNNPERFIEILFRQNVPVERIFSKIGECGNSEDFLEKAISATKNYAEKIAETDTKLLSADGRVIYARTLAEANIIKYKPQLMELTGDTSKNVKAALSDIFANQREWTDDIKVLLKDKKQAKRDLALMIIEKQGAENYRTELETAFDTEKSDKLKVKIASLIGVDYEVVNLEKADTDIISSLTKNTKKIAWLFEKPFRTVKLIDGSIADEKYIKALIMSYANMENGKIPETAKGIAMRFVPEDTQYIANEVFIRWIESGAAAKYKWILYLTAIHGGNDGIAMLMKYIKEWSEHSRGAIASDAVRAMAMNGTSIALMNVDSIARKFKNRQVRSSAENALKEAADEFGITTEELADKIVPDFGFDEKLCRVFDYGNRKFEVYITPSLELEIFNGDKKIKSMPKAGVNDDKDKAEKAIAEFKEMKKQLKVTVTAQKARLEYVLMNNRKWTAEGWKNLFVKNPVMHCFAVGLVWGTYNGDTLESTFRYMDDGSFTTADEDEYELPEKAVIGLVHPIELSEDEKNTWIEQLSDYEIIQPFPQLSRSIYRMSEQEKKSKSIERFRDIEISGQTLLGRMLKAGWYRGEALDGGWFVEFYRDDISRIVRNEKGESEPQGFIAELKFSGMSISYVEYESVDIESLLFYHATNYRHNKNTIDVTERYFSEIVLQLTGILGTNE